MDNSLHISCQTTILSVLDPLCQPITTLAHNFPIPHRKSWTPSKTTALFVQYWPLTLPCWKLNATRPPKVQKATLNGCKKFLKQRRLQQLIPKLWYKLWSERVRNIRSLCPSASIEFNKHFNTLKWLKLKKGQWLRSELDTRPLTIQKNTVSSKD